MKYTEEKRNSLDKEAVIQLFLSQQEQLEHIDHTLQLVLEQVADLKRRRFGRSSEKHETESQISFMEVDGKIVFFNESEAVCAEASSEDPEAVLCRKPKKKQGKREEDLDGLLLNGEFWSPPTAHYFIHPNRNSGGIASPNHDSAAILFILSYHSYVRAWLFAAAMTISALIQCCSCWAPIVSASVIRLSVFLAFPSL